MTFHLVHQHSLDQARSPFHIVEHETGREVAWINRYLDREWVRRLAETSLRSYALDLLHFLRWWIGVHHTDAVTEAALTESTLLDYVRFQSGQQLRPAAASINRRIIVVEQNHSAQLYHHLIGQKAIPPSAESVARPGPLPFRPSEIASYVV